MHSRWFLLSLSLVALLPAVAAPGQVREQIRVQTTLVNVPVMVSDEAGGTVLGLAAQDFALYDDGVLQPLAFFAAATEPIRVALLLDTSKSTATVLDRIRKAADGFVSQLRPGDEAMVVSFDSEVNVLCRWKSEQEEIRKAIRGAVVGNYVGSRMRDAVALAVEKYLRPGQGRKAIILLTDGQDYGSSVSPDDVVRAVVDSGVVMYPVLYRIDRRELAKKLFGISLPKATPGGEGWVETERAALDSLQRMAAESAGALYHSEIPDLKKTFARVADELRHQYLLAFYPDPSRVDGADHILSVSASRSGLKVRARTSYRAAAAKHPQSPSMQ